MIPYFEIPTLKLGPIPIQPFGILVAIGCLLGAWVVRKRADKDGLDIRDTEAGIGWVLVCGFIGSHLFDVFAYTPGELADDPLLLLRIWDGISSYGGFLGAAAGFLFITWRRKMDRLRHVNPLALGLSVGWIFGRLGCTVVHDHPGRLSDFFLAVDYPGGSRLDLGFLELLYALVLAGVLHLLARKPRPPGFLVAVLATAYAVVRFGLDFLRRTDGVRPDPRYFGLTPAHYLSIATLIIGIVLFVLAYRRAGEPVPVGAPEPAPLPVRAPSTAQRRKKKRK